MIPATVYMLCAVTCVLCAVLLLNANRKAPSPLLFWSGVFFSLFAVSNVLLFIDLVLVAEVDLSLLRAAMTAVAHLVLVIGFISKPSRL